MKRLFAIAFIFIINSSWAWTLFDQRTEEECISQMPKVRLSDAKNLLQMACYIGYGDGKNKRKEWVSTAKCVAKSPDEFYSFDASMKVIKQCSDDPKTLEAFRGQLYLDRDVREAAAAYAPIAKRLVDEKLEKARAERNRARLDQDGLFTMFDAQTGRYMSCIRTGTYVSCY